MQTTPSPLLALEYELQHEQLKRVLLYHNTDRWYFGDFIRHSTWLSCLSAMQPESLELATTAAYLPLYQDERVHNRIDVAHFDPSTFAEYDLVVIPAAYPPAVFDDTIKRAIYTWDRGWAYVRYGTAIITGDKSELNYFIAARHQFGQTALATSDVFSLQFNAAERDAAAVALSKIFGKTKKIVIYNPTASNAFTRETSIKKEVDNQLGLSQHSIILRELQNKLPDHVFLVASAIKPGDTVNEDLVKQLARAGDPQITKSVYDLPLESSTTLRGFASVLAASQIVGMVGTGTGTNTHLASLVGLPAFSIERSADEAMVDNWLHPEQFQMGSFRWRNPAHTVATYNLDWANITADKLASIADAFVCHLQSTAGAYEKIFTISHSQIKHLAATILDALEQQNVSQLAQQMTNILQLMTSSAAAHYGDFSDEMKYLSLQDEKLRNIKTLGDFVDLPRDMAAQYGELMIQLVEYSNLHKLLQSLVPQRTVAKLDPVDTILKKIQVGKPLTGRELAMVHAKSEKQFAAEMNKAIAKSGSIDMADTLHYDTKNGWQHSVKLYDEVVVKTFSTNPLSEYLTDDYTRIGIDTALGRSGGLIPHSLMHGDELISQRLTLFVTKDLTVPLYGNRPQSEVVMPYGWAREQLDRHVDLLRRGIFNFDYTLSDTGINSQGVMQVVDFSVFRLATNKLLSAAGNRRTAILRMGFGELVRNGQVLARFKNGRELVDRYASDIERVLGIAIRPYIDNWEWGDHEKESYDHDIEQLGRTLAAISGRPEKPSPVYGLVNHAAVSVAYDFIKDRLGNGK